MEGRLNERRQSNGFVLKVVRCKLQDLNCPRKSTLSLRSVCRAIHTSTEIICKVNFVTWTRWDLHYDSTVQKQQHQSFLYRVLCNEDLHIDNITLLKSERV